MHQIAERSGVRTLRADEKPLNESDWKDRNAIVESKPVIGDIDRVLDEHYGFTDEELDFIINYDIKYRMGDRVTDGSSLFSSLEPPSR